MKTKAMMGAALAVGLGMASAAVSADDGPLKVGFVYVGPVSDHGWSYQHDQGRQAVVNAFGDRVETRIVESVQEGADSARVLDGLAASGHRLIFATSFGFMNSVIRVARRHPEVRFEHCTGYKRADNVATYMARFYEGRHVVGLLAGALTETNIIGYIGSHPIPEVIRGINAFTIALRRVNPDAEVRVIWVNSWYDPGKEAEAAKALIDQGADVLLQHTDSPAPMTVAEQRGVWAVGQASDMSRFGPTAHITSIVDIWDAYYVRRTQEVLDGTWQSGDVWGGFADEMVYLADYNPSLAPELVEMAETARREIIAGTRHPFTGPIRAQDGSVMVAEGETLSDDALLRMDAYVEGVQGSIPK